MRCVSAAAILQQVSGSDKFKQKKIPDSDEAFGYSNDRDAKFKQQE